jgi:hypothetical protein
MTKRISLRLIWAVVVAVLLGSAYVIVQRNGAATSRDAPAVYSH